MEDLSRNVDIDVYLVYTADRLMKGYKGITE